MMTMVNTQERRVQTSTGETIVDILEQNDFTGFRNPEPELPRLRMKQMIDDYPDERESVQNNRPD